MKAEKFFNDVKEEFNKYQSYYVFNSVVPYRIIGEKILKYCKVKKGKVEFYSFEGEYSNIIGYSLKPNTIYLNPNYFYVLKDWKYFLNVVVHEIAHLKGVEHTENGLMSDTIIIPKSL